MTISSRAWQELATTDFTQTDPASMVAILPVGAIEQHGPHLPLGVDTMIVDGILARALTMAEPDLPLIRLPTLPIGKSDEHQAFPGTLSFSADTLTRVWVEVGASLARTGLRRLILFNGHGGQVAIMDVAARELRIRHDMLVMAWSWFAAGWPAGLFEQEEARTGIHAGAIETSVMLHLHPQLVRMDQARRFEPLAAQLEREGYRRLSPIGPGRMGWMAQDLNPAGACGDALDADPERGRQLVDHAAAGLLELVREMARFPLERLRSGPG